MISLSALARLAETYADDVDLPVAPLQLAGRVLDTDAHPVVMGCVNLSRDSTYRESIATSTRSAVRKGLVLAAQGADLVDVGAESSTARASRVDPAAQIRAMVPVVEELAAAGVAVSAETYHPDVARACLQAGAQVLNYTGAADDETILPLVAAAGATVVLCHVRGDNVRDVTDVVLDDDPLPGLLAYFETRVAAARKLGVERIVIDPGMGFYYGNLVDPATRLEHQTRVLLNSFRLRRLGLPVCHALPHAFDLFEDQFRTAEGFFAVLARLGGAGVLRTHEVPQVVAVLAGLGSLTVG